MERRKSGKVLMQKKVVTKTVTSTRQRRTSDRFQYVEDLWEKNPKTDYTYSRSASYGTGYLKKGYISPNMSRRGMHRDVSYLEVPQETSTMTQNSAVVGRLDYSADEDDTTQESTRSTSRSVRSRRPTPVRTTPAMSSASMQSSVQSTPSGVQLHKTFSDSTTRQGTSYSVEWTLDSKGRRRRSTRLARMVGAQDTTDHMGQNDENTRREYEHEFSDKDSRLQYLYGLDGPDYGDGIDSSVAVTYADDEDDYTDDSDNEVYVNDVMREHQEESLVTTTITTIATIITTIFTIIFYIPVKTVEVVSAQFQPGSHTRSHTQTQHTSIYSQLWTSISTITSTVFYIISAPVYGLWYITNRSAHGAAGIAHRTGDAAHSSAQGFGDILRNSLNAVSNGLFTVLTSIFSVISYVATGIWDILRTTVITTSNSLLTMLTTISTALLYIPRTLASGSQNIIQKSAEGGGSFLRTTITTVSDLLLTVLTAIFTALWFVPRKLTEGASCVLESLFNGTGSVLGKASDGVMWIIYSIYEAVLYFMRRCFQGVSYLITSVAMGTGYLLSLMSDGMFRLLTGIFGGFSAMICGIYDALSNGFSTIIRGFSDGLLGGLRGIYEALCYALIALVDGTKAVFIGLVNTSYFVLQTLLDGALGLLQTLYSGVTGIFTGVSDGSRTVAQMISDSVLHLLYGVYYSATYVVTGVYSLATYVISGLFYSVASVVGGIGAVLGYVTSGLFRVDNDDAVTMETDGSPVQFEQSSVVEETSYVGAGANMGAKYPASSARRRSSRRSKITTEVAAVARERLSKYSDNEEEENFVSMTTSKQSVTTTWWSWLLGLISTNNTEDSTDGGVSLARSSEGGLSLTESDSEEDNLVLWMLSWATWCVTCLVVPLMGVLSWLWWRVGGGAHGAIAQTVQSDVWLLSRTSRLRRRYGCCCLLPLLLLLPFFLASSYYISERGVGLGAFPIFPILAANDSRCCVVQQGTNLTDQELQQKVQAILVGLLADQESRQEQMYADQRKELTAAQLAALASHRGELEKMVHGVLKDELAVFTAAQGEKEREFQRQAQETAEAQAAAAVLVAKSQTQGSQKSAEQYSNIVSQINLMGSKNDGKMDDLSAAIAAVQAKADTLALELEAAKANAQKSTGDSNPSGAAILQLEDQIASLRTDITNLHGAQAALLGRVGECCKNNSALALLIKTAVKDEMALLMGGTSGGGGGWFGGNDGDSRQGGGFMGWLSGRFAAQEDVDAKLAALAARLSDQIEAIPTTNAQGQQQMMYMHDGVELTAEQVRTMIRDALLLYGADKTGQPDYALESAGGSIISTRCSETYHRRTAQLSLFGIPLWYASNSPRSVIQPDVHPGQCWAFKGTQGYLVVQLAGEIYPTAFAMEHIPKALSPTGNIDSAPKDFSVMGLEHDRDTEGVLMGNFTYRDDGEPLQHFTLQEPSSRSFSLIEVRIHTNHGNPEYTCLYRFRVHGNLRRW